MSKTRWILIFEKRWIVKPVLVNHLWRYGQTGFTEKKIADEMAALKNKQQSDKLAKEIDKMVQFFGHVKGV